MFLFGCIPSRFYWLIFSLNSQTHLKIAGLYCFYLYLDFYTFTLLEHEKLAETIGAPIWWNHLRPVHALLYLVSAIMALQENKRAYMPIVIDTLFGLVAFTCYHF